MPSRTLLSRSFHYCQDGPYCYCQDGPYCSIQQLVRPHLRHAALAMFAAWRALGARFLCICRIHMLKIEPCASQPLDSSWPACLHSCSCKGEHPCRGGPAQPARASASAGDLGSDRVGHALLREARLSGTRQLLLCRGGLAGLGCVAFALFHEAGQGRPGEFLIRHLGLAG